MGVNDVPSAGSISISSKPDADRSRKLFLKRVLKIFWVPRLGAVSVPLTPSFCGVGEFACLRPEVEFANSNEQVRVPACGWAAKKSATQRVPGERKEWFPLDALYG